MTANNASFAFRRPKVFAECLVSKDLLNFLSDLGSFFRHRFSRRDGCYDDVPAFFHHRFTASLFGINHQFRMLGANRCIKVFSLVGWKLV